MKLIILEGVLICQGIECRISPSYVYCFSGLSVNLLAMLIDDLKL